MAHSYKPVDRDQLFLLPPDIRDWLPEGHLAFFVLEVVERLDTRALHEPRPLGGAGRQAYDPDMLLGVLLYAYCTGERSSRRVERLCLTDVALRVVAANYRPDHTTIARFRADHAEAIAALFTDVLRLCREAGLLNLGVVAVDGTKMKANASIDANRTEAQVRAEVEKILAEAAETDRAEDEAFGERRGDELPDELADPLRRKARLDAALQELQRQAEERRAAEEGRAEELRRRQAKAAGQHFGLPGRRPARAVTPAGLEAELEQAEADYQVRLAEWHERRDDARAAGQPDPPSPGRNRRAAARRRLEAARAAPPPPPPSGPGPKVNVTDVGSRVMKTRQGWVQGYNAQAAVDKNGVIVSARVAQDHGDAKQCQPMIEDTLANVAAAGSTDEVGTLLFDAGYHSAANVTADGPDRLIASTKARNLRKQLRADGHRAGEAPPGATPLQQMEHRLLTQEGSALYALRQQLVEPAFGDIKENRGFRSFVRRGLTACDAEWKLICLTKNLTKLFTAAHQVATSQG